MAGTDEGGRRLADRTAKVAEKLPSGGEVACTEGEDWTTAAGNTSTCCPTGSKREYLGRGVGAVVRDRRVAEHGCIRAVVSSRLVVSMLRIRGVAADEAEDGVAGKL